MSVAALIGSAPLDADACTRVVYIGDSGIVITGRTLDWKENIGTNLYVMPRGMERTGYDDNNTIKWASKYGSVVAVGYDMGVSEGMNEKGLVCYIYREPYTACQGIIVRQCQHRCGLNMYSTILPQPPKLLQN